LPLLFGLSTPLLLLTARHCFARRFVVLLF